MAGEALTTEFMLGTATVMLGAMGNLYDLRPENHAIGLVKGVKIKTDPQFKDLTQGLQNTTVFSLKTGSVSKINFDVYEYTTRNLSYALGLNPADLTANNPIITATTALAASSALSITVASATNFVVGQFLIIEVGTRVIARKITAINALVITFAGGLPVAVPSGSVVRVPQNLALAKKGVQPYLGCKIAGFTAEGNPVTFLIPKVRVTNGFELGFMTDDYASMPFELSVYDMVSTDALYSDFQDQQAMLLIS